MAIRQTWLNYPESLAKQSQAYNRFYNGMKTDAVRSTYSYNMKRFMDYLIEKNEIQHNEEYDEITKFDGEKITDLLSGFIAHLNKTLKATTITVMLAAPELFFTMNRKLWHKKLVRKTIRKNDHEPGGKLPATDENIQDMLDVTKHVRDKAVIHFLASTGSRPAGISDPVLRMKHLVPMPNLANRSEKNYCYAIKIYEESKEGYWAFLTPEATKALNKYFSWRKNIRKEVFTDDTPIFGNFLRNSKYKHMSEMSLRKIVEKAIKRSAINRTKNGSKFDKAAITMFRKRFNGKLKMENSINSNIAEKLMAHKRGLDGTYLQPTREECYAEFVKAIPTLTVDPTERQKHDIELKNQRIDELESKNEKIHWLEKKICDVDIILKELERKLNSKQQQSHI